ncbi:aldehyde ferredoxin oxidoreductase N-terminal domain-containing protein, partial [Spirochaetota bacterium]
MDKRYGWTGKIAFINLSEGKIDTVPTDEYSKLFLGGLGIGQKIYWDESSPENDAFHRDNPLIFMTGPLTATQAPSAPRMSVCGKSPCIYPETFVTANLGGFFPAEIKKAGYDGLVVKGRADNPVYLLIKDNEITIKSAKHLWGQTNSETHDNIRNETDKKAKILSIGPGAENLTRIGIIYTDVAGSASMGFGSVMGSKNLKAIAAIGSDTIHVADGESIKSIRKEYRKMTGGDFFNLFGTPHPRPDVEVVKRKHCHGCPQGCWRSYQKLTTGEENIHKCQTSMFYSYWDRKLHGSLTEASFLASKIANDYSICIMDLAFLLLWIERCTAKGILTEKDIELPISKMGSIEFIEEIIKKISYKEGFGKILAQGTIRASENLGK